MVDWPNGRLALVPQNNKRIGIAMLKNFFRRVSAAPTNPTPKATHREFDIADLYRGPIEVQDESSETVVAL
nr:hypothetical protein [Pirellula sp.]